MECIVNRFKMFIDLANCFLPTKCHKLFERLVSHRSIAGSISILLLLLWRPIYGPAVLFQSLGYIRWDRFLILIVLAGNVLTKGPFTIRSICSTARHG